MYGKESDKSVTRQGEEWQRESRKDGGKGRERTEERRGANEEEEGPEEVER